MKILDELQELFKEKGINEKEVAPILYQLKKQLKDKKYGLVWEDKDEEVYKELLNKLPILNEITEREIKTDDTKPTNLLIEGDNLHSLRSLQYTHKGLVDVIYIDPPYNTGNKDFRYNDKYTEKEDTWKHSKWLSFMNKRLQLAKELLTESGVIFISIDDNEFAQLKLLCDSIFGEENSLNTIPWYKGYGKNESRFFSNSTEYIHCYAKNKQFMLNNNIGFFTEKEGYEDVMNIRNKILQKNKQNNCIELELENQIKAYYKNNPQLKGIKGYNKVEKDTLRIYSSVTMEKPKDPAYFYDVMHPITNKPCKIPSKGWNRPKSSMNELLKNNEILFGIDETKTPRRKYYLDTMKYETPKNFISNSNQGGAELKSILHDISKFDYPKPVSLIKYLINLIPNKNSIILDFFAGSGTTGQAILDLNKEDGGNRQFILCTNNENNICEEVTYQRLNKVINGYTTPKGKEVLGLGGNLKYYKVELEEDFEDIDETIDNLINKCTSLISIKENCYNLIKSTSSYDLISGEDKIVLIYKDSLAMDYEVKEVSKELFNYNYKNKVIYATNTVAQITGVELKEYPMELIKQQQNLNKKLI